MIDSLGKSVAPRFDGKHPSSTTLDLRGIGGLSEQEAARRLAEEGPNELSTESSHSLLSLALGVAKEPMFLMLVASGSLYLLMGETSDALMLLGFVFVVMTITIVQERRTERALEALRDLSSPRALVIRDHRRRRIPGREVVRGDFVVLSEGDRVPSDGLLRRGIHLETDESLLTGESVPVRKQPDGESLSLDKPGGDDLPSVFSGTLVTAGQGIIEIVATGQASELGKIGKAIKQVHPEPTLLQRETTSLVRYFALVGLLSCLFVVVGYIVSRGGSLEVCKNGILAGIALAMAVLPEEFPVILTVFLALGAWRISRRNVLTRKMPAVEMLGAATVLCVDKTGTLTQNCMTLRMLSVDEQTLDLSTQGEALPEAYHALLETAVLACKRDPFDPMERTLLTAKDRWLKDTEHIHPAWLLEREYPITKELLAVSHAWRTGSGNEAVVATKGAPEAVMDLCHLTPQVRQMQLERAAKLAAKGLRVLGVARGSASLESLPDGHHDLTFEFLGLIAFEDPLRPSVPSAVAECRTAGIRVVMITGDYPTTAQSIAAQAGIIAGEAVMTGSELDLLSDEELARRISAVQVFARVVPEQKLRIVTALKSNHEIVAMTGDGVNDAPALKAAHIGIAMGSRGTDVAREAASLVLLDDDFASIVSAVCLGRRIFDNIKKAVAFVLAVHLPIVGLSMLPVFFADWPLLLLPIHIAFLELIIDPTCSLIFEAEPAEVDIMQRPPRRTSERLFSAKVVVLALLQGFSVLAVCVGVFLTSRASHHVDAARTLTFVTLVTAVVVVIMVNRSFRRGAWSMLFVPNTALRWVVLATTLLLTLSLAIPVARRLFHFAPIHWNDLLKSFVAGLLCVLWFELVKAVQRVQIRNNSDSPFP